MDVHDKKTRSYNMSRIRATNTKPEEIVRKYLFSHGFRYRKNVRSLPGTPDIVLPKYHTVIFVNGCFWHRHGCRFTTTPLTNTEFWTEKFSANTDRDRNIYRQLQQMGWVVLIVWECELKKDKRESTLKRICETIETFGD